MDHPQRVSSNDPSNSTPVSSNMMPNVLFREIHKNAFLKRHSSDRRTGFPKKSERVWVVFCVHDDVEPFLEIYPDQKVALTHKPEWFASLSNVLHVSPTICGHEDDYEFAVTLSFQVVRLSAPSWESMMEWVETIRNKLRELKVLCPKENLYSKMPEQKQPLLPTRDPNSPLPLPPEGPSTLLPGVEIVHIEARNGNAINDNSSARSSREVNARSSNINDRRVVKKKSNHPERETTVVCNNPVQLSDSSFSNNHFHANIEVVPSSSGDVHIHKPRVTRAASVPQPLPSTSNIPSSSNITVIEVSTPKTKGNHSVSETNPNLNIDIPSDSEDEDDVFITSNKQKPDCKNSFLIKGQSNETHYEHVFVSNVPVVKAQVSQITDSKSSAPKKTLSTTVLLSANQNNSSQSSNVSNIRGQASLNNINSIDIFVGEPENERITRNCDITETDLNGPLSPQTQSKLEKVNISGFIPRVPAKSAKFPAFKPASTAKDSITNVREESITNENEALEGASASSNGEHGETNISVGLPAVAYSQVKKIPKSKIKVEGQGSPIIEKKNMNGAQSVDNELQSNRKLESIPSCSSSQPLGIDIKHKKVVACKKTDSEPVDATRNASRNILSAQTSNNEYKSEIPSASGSRIDNNTRVNLSNKDVSVVNVTSSNNNNTELEPIIASVQPVVGVITVEDIPLIGGHQRRRRRSSSSDPTPPSSAPPSRAIGGADRIRINVPLTGNIPPMRETPRSETEARCVSHNRNVSEGNSHVSVALPSTRLTLREQQVLQLKKEMLHPGGVRLQLRRKDCTGSIAFVDVLNGVWIAGWKQKEHPLLYNALHIGDQLISIGDVVVRTSAEAHKLIRSFTSLYIEFIIRRVPFGNVFALQRTSEGQNLGIVQEGNTAEIKDVLPNSIAAKQGLTAKTPSCDGLSLTTWFLTEINGRPLNLFFKDNEVRDRLNAVGKEISILVQPHDFIKQIKKQLKNIRSYKEYIVQ